MLVLTRKTQQQIQIGNNITITIVRVTGQSVRVGIQAPEEVRVIRGELASKPLKDAEEVTISESAPSATSAMPEMVATDSRPAAPLASRCRNRLTMPTATPTVSLQPTACVENRCRASGASVAPLIRRPQRLGPASLGSLSRMR